MSYALIYQSLSFITGTMEILKPTSKNWCRCTCNTTGTQWDISGTKEEDHNKTLAGLFTTYILDTKYILSLQIPNILIIIIIAQQ